jgi:hypothetical protein
MRKSFVAIAILASLAVPTIASAGPSNIPVAVCQALPVATPGITVLGHRVPAASDVSVCVLADTNVEAIPVIVDQPECGNPCVTVEIHGLEVAEDVAIAVDLKLDGQSQHIAFDPDRIGVNPAPDSRLCVIGVGTPDPCTDRVTTPRSLEAKAKRSPTRASLSWIASRATGNTTVAGYQVWRSDTNEPSSFQQIGTSTGTSYVDSTVQRGQTYWYYVVAWDGKGNSSPASNTASATIR